MTSPGAAPEQREAPRPQADAGLTSREGRPAPPAPPAPQPRPGEGFSLAGQSRRTLRPDPRTSPRLRRRGASPPAGRAEAGPQPGPPPRRPPRRHPAAAALPRLTPPPQTHTPGLGEDTLAGREAPARATHRRPQTASPSLPARRSQDGIPPARTPAERGSVAAAPVTERQELRGLGGRLSRQLGPGPGPDQSLAASHRWQGPPEGASPAAPTSRWQSPRSSPPAPPRALPPLAFQCRQGAAVATALSSGSRACWARPGRDLKEQTLFPPPFSSCRPTRAAPPWAAAGTTATRTARRPQAVNPPFKAVVFSRGVEGFYALDVTAI